MAATIHIARDFSRFPGGRVKSDGPWTGEQFREEKLLPALRANEVVTVVIDDEVAGLPPSFLEEAFGGVVRLGYFSAKEMQRRLRVIAESGRFARYPDMVWTYINSAVLGANGG